MRFEYGRHFYFMETWKKIKSYQDYEVSNLGNVKSLKFNTSKILKPTLNSNGYYIISLSENGIVKKRKLHQLVAQAFLNHIPNGMELVINHKVFNKLNNRVDNLEIISQRQNTSTRKNLHKKTSKYIGVCFKKGKYEASIQIDGKIHYLGRFTSEYDAHIAYTKKLNNNG